VVCQLVDGIILGYGITRAGHHRHRADPAQRESGASAPTETCQGLSGHSVIKARRQRHAQRGLRAANRRRGVDGSAIVSANRQAAQATGRALLSIDPPLRRRAVTACPDRHTMTGMTRSFVGAIVTDTNPALTKSD
jgi:hypothetical protein